MLILSTTTQAWSPATPNAAYEINVTTKTSGTIQLNALRGRVFLPHSCASATKQSTLVVFASGQAAQAAREAGADVVGGQELIDDILAGNVNPDKLITTTEMFALFQRNPTLARTLGPRGLMPSAKRGTVTDDIVQAVKEARGGLDWKGDNKGIVRAGEAPLARFSPSRVCRHIRKDADRPRNSPSRDQPLADCISSRSNSPTTSTLFSLPLPTSHRAATAV